MTIDLPARLNHLRELDDVRRTLARRIQELEQPIHDAAHRWMHGARNPRVTPCCEIADIEVFAYGEVDDTVHFEWGCPLHLRSSEVFRIHTTVLQTLLDRPKS